tara:strand:- start:611 stop:889 length:279 start_codon:yes stop_codon:yes gene_type:complete
MALRKNNQKDYEKFANPNIDVLGNPKKVTGENTDKVKKDKKGNPFALVMESTQSGLMKGDTIRPGSAPMVDGYIMGGDYNISKKSSKNYKID